MTTKQRSVDEQIASLNEKEKEAFNELRSFWDSESRVVTYSDYMILRLLRASPGKEKFNVKTAKKVAEKFAIWLEKNEFNKIGNITRFRAELETGDSFVWTGQRDKFGNPLLYYKVKGFVPKMMEPGFYNQGLVYLLQCITEDEETSKNGIAIIHDLKGFAMSNFSLALAKQTIDIFQGGYPCRIRKIYVVDAPGIFSMIWRMVRPLLTQELIEKINIISSKKLIEDFVDPSCCPVEVGGTLDIQKELNKFIQERCEIEGYDYSAPYPERPLRKAEINIE